MLKSAERLVEPISRTRVLLLATLAMLAFAANSLLCRAALLYTDIDAASFTSIRLISGALMLWLIAQMRQSAPSGKGNWASAFALFVYAAGFSFAYMTLTAATGALLLFGAVQVTMISYGLWIGERFRPIQLAGFILAFSGLIALLLPGLSAPPLGGSLLMVAAGVAWGVYSLRGNGSGDAVRVTAGNFLRAVPMAALVSVFMLSGMSIDTAGIVYAVASGALASGVGYAIWYTALPALKATSAATMQLSVPVLTAIGGVILLSEPITWRLTLTSAAILGGVAMVIWQRQKLSLSPKPSNS